MKRKITLEGGRVVDCGVEEFDELQAAIKSQDPDRIAKASIGVLASSDDIMMDITRQLKEFVKNMKENDKDGVQKQRSRGKNRQ